MAGDPVTDPAADGCPRPCGSRGCAMFVLANSALSSENLPWHSLGSKRPAAMIDNISS